MSKKLLKIIIPIVIILVPIIGYISIVIANNTIANNIEKELKSYPLPVNTQIADSISATGKLTGNGNGMQYFGALLISTELDEEDIIRYYQVYSKNIRIEKQETEKIVCEPIHSELTFDNFDQSKNNYIIYSWGSYQSNGFVSALLDLDLRGH